MMNKLLIIPVAAVLMLASVEYYASEDYVDSYKQRREQSFKNPNNLKSDPFYVEMCGSCHMAYQPELLPRRSWKKIVETLNDHFGTDASVSPDESRAIMQHLMNNAADRKRVGTHFMALAGSIKKVDVPLRITDTPFFKKAHSELAKEHIIQPEVKSLSNCNACHTKAKEGDYRKRNIFIPNHGPWED